MSEEASNVAARRVQPSASYSDRRSRLLAATSEHSNGGIRTLSVSSNSGDLRRRELAGLVVQTGAATCGTDQALGTYARGRACRRERAVQRR